MQSAYEGLINNLLQLGKDTPNHTTVTTFTTDGRAALIAFLNELYGHCNSVDCPVYLRT